MQHAGADPAQLDDANESAIHAAARLGTFTQYLPHMQLTLTNHSEAPFNYRVPRLVFRVSESGLWLTKSCCVCCSVGTGREPLLRRLVEARGAPTDDVRGIIEGEDGETTPLHLAALHGHAHVGGQGSRGRGWGGSGAVGQAFLVFPCASRRLLVPFPITLLLRAPRLSLGVCRAWQVVTYLLDCLGGGGANPNVRDSKGETAIYKAAKEGHTDVSTPTYTPSRVATLLLTPGYLKGDLKKGRGRDGRHLSALDECLGRWSVPEA